MIAFFIDADNLCVSSWVEESLRKLEDGEGRVLVRRAYGSAEKLKGLADVLRTRHIRPFVNLALSKNTTDVALAVDVMDLSYQTPRPTVIAIGSGDADFVPLVLRLRERGFRMVCVSEQGKMAPEAVYAYDHVIFVGQEQAAEVLKSPAAELQKSASPPAKLPAVRTAAKKAAAKKVAAKKAPAAKKVAAKKAKPAAKQNAGDAAGKVTVDQILNAVSSLRAGQPQSLGEVVKLLHDAKVLGKNATSTKLFKKFPLHFELLPPKQPNQIRYIPSP
ncbi:NYN domain-containing protein [Variovorax sp. CCNWLW186]|uniref:NYN domain-containing protein n=1 Tax=Variovorax sp. CCNWLW186 TaxID=3127473 RepID=UPI003076AB15